MLERRTGLEPLSTKEVINRAAVAGWVRSRRSSSVRHLRQHPAGGRVPLKDPERAEVRSPDREVVL